MHAYVGTRILQNRISCQNPFWPVFFWGTDDFLTPPVCMVQVCQQLNYLPRDMLGSSCISLGVFSPLALGVRLFFFWTFYLRSLAVLQVLYLQLRQLVSLHCGNLENLFQKGSGIQNPARVGKTNLMRLLLCSVVVMNIAPAGTRKTRPSFLWWCGRSWVCTCEICFCLPRSSMWLSQLGISGFTPSFSIGFLFTTTHGPCMCATN